MDMGDRLVKVKFPTGREPSKLSRKRMQSRGGESPLILEPGSDYVPHPRSYLENRTQRIKLCGDGNAHNTLKGREEDLRLKNGYKVNTVVT